MSPLKKEIIALPLALIDAQDASFVEPLREFLSSSGCDVAVNRIVARPVSYHIICGGASFVKGILERRLPPTSKRLVILWDGEHDDLPHDRGYKTILIDARPLTKERVEEIFSFFFTGRKEILRIRKEQGQPVRVTQRPVSNQHEDRDEERVRSVIAEVFRPEKKPKKKIRWVRWLTAAVLCLLLPWALYGTFLAISGAALFAGGRMMLAGNYAVSARAVGTAQQAIRGARRVFPFAGWQLAVLGGRSAVATQEQLMGFLDDASTAAAGAGSALATGQRLGSTLFSPDVQGAHTVAADITKLRTQLGAVSDHLALSQAQLDALAARASIPFAPNARETIATMRRSVSFADELLTLYPHIAGFAGTQTYLLLFQNSMELRPTGGFIGSIGTASFEDGRMSDLAVSDVYTLDGQLKGHVDPPRALRELLALEHWYLRDSNWDPDFATSATQAAWFYEKETGNRVDGVIAVSVPFVIDLLRATGPLELTDFNDRVTAENFFGKSLLYTQTDFFPGSTQKKDFLGSLSSALLRRVTTERGAATGAVLEAVVSALEKKNIMFYFPDPELEALVRQYGWAGEATVIPEGATDGLALVEANLGVNKANYFVTREVLDQVALDEELGASHLVTIQYRNSSPHAEDSGGGTYRAYLRFLLPQDAAVETVSVNGIALAGRDLSRPEAATLPFAQMEQHTRVPTLGIAFEVPAGGQTQVAVSYRRGTAMAWDGEEGVYSIALRAQPGMGPTVWQTNIQYPLFWVPTARSERGTQSFIANQARLEYNTDLSRDQRISIQFTK